MKVHSSTLSSVWVDTTRRHGGALANAALLALIAAFVSEALFNHWTVGTVATQVAATVLLAVGIFVASLVIAVHRLEAKLDAGHQNFDVVQIRIGIHKGIAAVLGVPAAGAADNDQLHWLARRAIEVLRTDRYLSQEKVRQIEEIAGDESVPATERLATLEQHLHDRLVEGRYLLP